MLKWLSQHTVGKSVGCKRKKKYDLRRAARDDANITALSYKKISAPEMISFTNTFEETINIDTSKHGSRSKQWKNTRNRISFSSGDCREELRPRQLSPSTESRLCSPCAGKGADDDEFFLICQSHRVRDGDGSFCHTATSCQNSVQKPLQHNSTSFLHNETDTAENGDSRFGMMTNILQRLRNGERPDSLDGFVTPLRRRSISAEADISSHDECRSRRDLYTRTLSDQESKTVVLLGAEGSDNGEMCDSNVFSEKDGVTRIQVATPRRCQSEGTMMDEQIRTYPAPPFRSVSTCITPAVSHLPGGFRVPMEEPFTGGTKLTCGLPTRQSMPRVITNGSLSRMQRGVPRTIHTSVDTNSKALLSGSVSAQRVGVKTVGRPGRLSRSTSMLSSSNLGCGHEAVKRLSFAPPNVERLQSSCSEAATGSINKPLAATFPRKNHKVPSPTVTSFTIATQTSPSPPLYCSKGDSGSISHLPDQRITVARSADDTIGTRYLTLSGNTPMSTSFPPSHGYCQNTIAAKQGGDDRSCFLPDNPVSSWLGKCAISCESENSACENTENGRLCSNTRCFVSHTQIDHIKSASADSLQPYDSSHNIVSRPEFSNTLNRQVLSTYNNKRAVSDDKLSQQTQQQPEAQSTRPLSSTVAAHSAESLRPHPVCDGHTTTTVINRHVDDDKLATNNGGDCVSRPSGVGICFSEKALRQNAALFVASSCDNTDKHPSSSSPKVDLSDGRPDFAAPVSANCADQNDVACCGLRDEPWASFSWQLDRTALAQQTSSGRVVLTAELVDHLSWCSDAEFDTCVQHFSTCALTALLEQLQLSIAAEQERRHSMHCQLQLSPASARNCHLVAALVSVQERLSQLCTRSVRCFAMHAMRVGESSGPAVASFRDSLTFFQRAALLDAASCVARTGACSSGRPGRRSSVGSDDSSSSAPSVDSQEECRQVALPAPLTSFGCSQRENGVAPAAQSVCDSDSVDIGRTQSAVEEQCNSKTAVSLEASVQPPQRRPYIRPSEPRQLPAQVTRAVSHSCLAGEESVAATHSTLNRAPSVDEILASVKTLCAKRQDSGSMMMRAGAFMARWNSSAAAGSATSPPHHAPLYDTPACRSASVEAIYDQPGCGSVFPESDGQPTYMNARTPCASAAAGAAPLTEYDVPRAASHVYDSPQNLATYDIPRVLVPNRAATDSFNCHRNSLTTGQILDPATAPDHDCDHDSLEGSSPPQPAAPTAVYALEYNGEHVLDDFCSGDLDEGLGESSDARSYYNDDAGLEVIMEEPEEEEEYGNSSDEERPSPEQRPGRGSLASLQESEGVFSAGEGECSSHSSVTLSSGVHSTEGSPTITGGVRESDEKEQRDRCVEVYPETVRQRKQSKKKKSVDIQQWKAATSSDKLTPTLQESGGSSSNDDSHTVLPSVKSLKSHFETPKSAKSARDTKKRAPPIPASAEKSARPERAEATKVADKDRAPESSREGAGGSQSRRPVAPIHTQFSSVDDRLLRPALATRKWSPMALVDRLYELPDPSCKSQGQEKEYLNMEGWLEKLPSGRKKATFWNAWKRRYFKANNGFLRYYQNANSDTANLTLQLMGGNVEVSDNCVIGVDDGKGHYVVVRCSSAEETDRWSRSLRSQTVEDFDATYIRPVPIPPVPASFRRCIVIDIGSTSIRAGILHPEPTLPQVFMPAALVLPSGSGGATSGATGGDVRRRPVCGRAALHAEARAAGRLTFPLRPGARVARYCVDVAALQLLMQAVFSELRLTDASNYDVQVCLPRSLNTSTLAAILSLLFDQFGARGVNLTHQSILAMWSYNATSGVVVDIGERMDVVPVIDGYIVQSGVSRLPYGGLRLVDHVRQFLLQKRHALATEVEQLLVRLVLERLCYVAGDYQHELVRCQSQPETVEKALSVKEYVGDCASWRRIELDAGRFQATEGLFNPEAWGLDNQGVHKLVHKAIQECGIDGRREMARSIYLAGGVTLLPGFAERLQREMDKITPPSVTPKVHASPYRYHAAYLGACVLAASDGFQQAKVSRDNWLKLGPAALNKWTG